MSLLPGNKAVIDIGNYTTPEMDRSYECVMAFGPVDSIERIDKVSLVNVGTRRLLPNYDWARNDTPNFELSALFRDSGMMTNAPAAGWQGFFTQVPGGSRGGVIHRFRLEVTLKKGTIPEQLLSDLRTQGILANASANPDGTLDYGHYHLRQISNGNLHLNFLPNRPDGKGQPTVPLRFLPDSH